MYPYQYESWNFQYFSIGYFQSNQNTQNRLPSYGGGNDYSQSDSFYQQHKVSFKESLIFSIN